jgi:hypothetical protein
VTSNKSLEGALIRQWLGAVGAGRDCAPAALVLRGRAAPQRHR